MNFLYVNTICVFVPDFGAKVKGLINETMVVCGIFIKLCSTHVFDFFKALISSSMNFLLA